MKKLILAIVILIAGCTAASAQTETRIGSNHKVAFGTYYGYGQGRLRNYGSIFMDIYSAKTDLRTRVSIGDLERWVNPFVSVDAHYVLPLAEGFSIYPFVGVSADFRNVEEWEPNFDFAPEGGLGLEYQFSGNFGIFAEGRFQSFIQNKESRMSANIGITFAFGEGSRNK